MRLLAARRKACKGFALDRPPKGYNQALLKFSILTACMQAVKIENFKCLQRLLFKKLFFTIHYKKLKIY